MRLAKFSRKISWSSVGLAKGRTTASRNRRARQNNGQGRRRESKRVPLKISAESVFSRSPAPHKTEITKLSTYPANAKTYPPSRCRHACHFGKTATVWELADMLRRAPIHTPLEFLDRILREGEQPLQILAPSPGAIDKLMEASELGSISNPYQATRASRWLRRRPWLQSRAPANSPNRAFLAGLKPPKGRRPSQRRRRFPRTILESSRDLTARIPAPSHARPRQKQNGGSRSAV